MPLTTQHKIFMIEAYFRTGALVNGNWQYSQRLCLDNFREHFPNVAILPDNFYACLTNCVEVFRETGCVTHKKGAGRPRVRTEEVVNDVRQRMEEEPAKPLKRLSQEIGLSYGTCHKILKKDLNMHPYKMQAHQALLPADHPRRLAYCHWFVNNLMNDDLLDLTFFSDEAWFHLSGYINSQNMRMWSNDNPHVFTESPLHAQKIGVWMAVSRRRIIGPIFFDFTVNAERYRHNFLAEFVQQLNDDELRYGYFQHDGATAHTTRENIAFLREFFDDRLISLHTEVEFPPRSPCLTIMDYFIFPYLKNKTFATPVNNLQELQQRIVQQCATITPEMLQNAFHSMRRRVNLCIEQNGGHFQQLL